MTTYVLVHGAWHGAWCWNKVVPGLEAAGHKVITPELPGSGEDSTPATDVTLEAYANKLVEVLDQQDEKVVMLGHSMGGLAISAAAELRPDKIGALVYLSGFLPQSGQSLLSLEESNPHSSVPSALQVAEDGVTGAIKAEMIKDLFYHDCSDEDVAFATAHQHAQALAPLGTPVIVTDENFGSVPRYYIELLSDHAIHIDMQRQMVAASPCKEVFSIDSSHSPFYSKNEELIETLQKISV
ncbi:MAG: alpha/beta hydrolase [SAR86 cluster bacterium]|uniref:Alpha/beta hydrolase n=1 Tax=SAR86 cluster bacterium TaxID=2030880 RepID=A0A2A5C9K5_9GAMM|nr:MAG: alpha/beta hydrolase [SAR86 cluster bacterium]